MAEPIISAQDVHLFYGKNEALKGISLDYYEHEITAMIGPSGCGKSTFLRTLNRMNDLIDNVTITGSVKVDGQNIYAPTNDLVALRKKVGMVFQQPNPFPFSIYDNVAFGLNLEKGKYTKAEMDEKVEQSLIQAAVFDDVKDKLQESALSLSGGQQQRVCIARVLAVEPEVILMDEPTSALDPISSAKIEDMLMTLRDKYTIVIVTHNMGQASRISDRTAFFLQGHLIEYNETKKIFLNPDKKETEDYISGKFG